MTHERALRILDLPAAAGTAEVRLAYKDLVRVWHPDRFEGDARLRAKAGLRLAEINTAYRLLSTGPAMAIRVSAGVDVRPTGADVRRSDGARFTEPRGRRRTEWTGAAATAALLFGVICVAMALMLTSTPVI